MVSKLALAWILMAVCVTVHVVGVSAAVRWLARSPRNTGQFWPGVWLFVSLAGWMIVLHLIEIVAWGLVYWWSGALVDMTSAVYFSAVTYTTTGYGDLVLPQEWRLVGAIEALTGILMCGLSTGLFFAVVSRMFRIERP